MDMPTLPGVLAPVRAAVASVLRSPDHAGNLYSADDVALALNVAVDAVGGALVDVAMILRAFANKAKDEFVLKYDEYFHCHGDGHVLYVRHEAKPGRHEGKKKLLFVGRFGSMESARLVAAVRFHIGMDDGVRARLVSFLDKKKRSKRRL